VRSLDDRYACAVTGGIADGETPPSARTRTSKLLIEAAREQLREGAPMTVAAVAARAHVSRATAYRYFANNEGVMLAATVPPDQPAGLHGELSSMPGSDALPLAERAAVLVRSTAIWAFEHETELRAVLALTLLPESRRHGVTRRGITNRSAWIAELLNGLPPSVSATARHRLSAALVPLFGADAVVWTTDVANWSQKEAPDLLAWMAETLTAATVDSCDIDV
jgi:AcrR family transcriptional regulator